MSPKLPSLKPKEVVRALKKAGFVERRQKGSHLILKNEATGRLVVVPMHNRDLAIGTLKDILEHSGLTEDEFLALL